MLNISSQKKQEHNIKRQFIAQLNPDFIQHAQWNHEITKLAVTLLCYAFNE